jgi:sugar phosphate isomerase/epimerase
MSIESTRRGFLGSAGAGLAALGTAGRASAVIEPEPWGIKLGVATYSLRKFSRTDAIKMIQAIKTPWVSIKEFHLLYKSTPEERAAGRREFEAAGLKIMSGGNISLSKDDPEDIRYYFEYAKACGMGMMVCAPTHSNLNTVEKFVKEYNIQAAIHNHGPEDKHFPSPEVVLEAVKGRDPRMGLCMDIGHTRRTGTDPVDAAIKAGSRLLDVHVKDLADSMKKESQCDVGDGSLPIVALFKQLKKMNYKGCVNLEYEINVGNPLPGMQRSFSYMRGVLAGLAG